MELSESTFDTGEVRLHVTEGPRNGPPLVFLHGATGSGKDWLPFAQHFESAWHIYLVDERGHGLSGRSPNGVEGYRLSAFARDAAALLTGLVQEPSVLFGHSWGALTSLLAAPKVENLRAVVAEDPPVLIYRNAPENKPYLEYFRAALAMKQTALTYAAVLASLRKMSADDPTPRPESELTAWAENMFHLDPDFLRMVANGSEPARGIDFRQAFKNIHCPVLLLQADPLQGGCLLDADLALVQSQAPSARRVYFPGAGHGIHAERPQEVVKAFEEFIRA